MVTEHRKPHGWGTDSLSAFLEDCHHNVFATFNNLKPEYNLLNNIHTLYKSIVDNLTNSPDWFAGFFLFRSHSSFLAGVRLSLSGQIPEVYMVLRGCLENALYGLYLSKNQKSVVTWLQRHDNEISKSKVREEFQVGKLLKSLQSIDTVTYRIASKLYERTIDYGGHPNEAALLQTIEETRGTSSVTYKIGYLLGDTGALRLGLKSTAQIETFEFSI